MSVNKCICVEGVSENSFDDAIKVALSETSKSIDNIFCIEVEKIKCNITNNHIIQYIACVKITFKVDLERSSK